MQKYLGVLASTVLLSCTTARATDWHEVYSGSLGTSTCPASLVCPLKAFHSGSVVGILEDDGTFRGVNPSGWSVSPFSTEDPYTTTDATDMYAQNSSSACWILADGTINCAGSSGALTGIPTGHEPYTHLMTNGRGTWATVGTDGVAYVWGTSIGVTTLSPKSGEKFTNVGVGYFNVCAVGDTGGVTCGGSPDTSHLTSSTSRPTSGTYSSVAVGRYAVLWTKSDGTTGGWATDNTTYKPIYDGLIAMRPTTGVDHFVINTTGDAFAVAHSTDGTATLFDSSTYTSTPNVIRMAPNQLACGPSGVVHSYKISNAACTGYMTFSDIEMWAENNSHAIAAVVVDPGNTFVWVEPDGTSHVEVGDAIQWGYASGDILSTVQSCYTPSE